MIHFSEEYLGSLVNEHKLICVSLGRLNDKHIIYTNSNGVPACEAALLKLKTRKAELEVMIDVLEDFLHG